ncbi:CBS domain-containing protein [Nodosilinea sp. P-1105]|uniref:CBS domain-containing protein n=1 Tax=Nodosilinea sp. P-1105 TaxID=2546229 RepID=UPI00146ADC21|nr:CBS domain-containing protein [Nodosilinea sp. P-1105]NMF82952.1 CBS domain-containing protein [Nodosilinea sp. P-1105]
MDLVLCHTTADFDTLGAAVGLARLRPGARVVLTGGCHPTVQRFVAFHRDEFPLIERRAVSPDQIRSLTLVDAQQPERFGPAAEWITQAPGETVPITIYDHHPPGEAATTTRHLVIDRVGATTTLVVEAMQRQAIAPTGVEATVMALGIHSDTGSLTFEQTTARDALALAWLMQQGASMQVIAEFVEPGLPPMLQDLLSTAMEALQTETIRGYGLAWVVLPVEGYIPGLSGLAERLISLADVDSLLLAAYYPTKESAQGLAQAGDDFPHPPTNYKLMLIGRAQGRMGLGLGIDWGSILTPLGGGGHPPAAAATLTTQNPTQVVDQALAEARSQLPHPPTARDLMSSPVRTIRPDTPMAEAQRILLRYGHSGLSVVDPEGQLVGVISRRDLDLALHHGLSHAPVKGYMATNLKTITPDTPLEAIEHLMVTYDIGRLPVLDQQSLVGIVTRTDLLRHLHQAQVANGLNHQAGKVLSPRPQLPPAPPLRHRLDDTLNPQLRVVLGQIVTAAQDQGWHLYLVGGAVRDLLLADGQAAVTLPDLDLVVDGFYQAARVGAGVDLAEAVKANFPEVELQVHGRFQTASLVWRKDLDHPLAGVMIDIATARTEFYPYPAANPEVEASSIQQDLYRRDFTINAMALRLTQPGAGQLLDYFGGLMDVRQGVVRVLHASSFIEDPTRIYRAVRFAVRLGFSLDPQTQGYIHHALDSGVYAQMQRQVKRVPALQVRLKHELKYILEAPYWQSALELLDNLRALRCIHDDLAMTAALWTQLRRMTRWVERFGWTHRFIPWQMRLEVLLAAVPAGDRVTIAAALQLPDSSIQRLEQLQSLEQDWLHHFATPQPPSQIYQALVQADTPTLLLVSARHPRTLGPLIWRYLTHLSQVQPLIDGHRLKTLGYRPGPTFRPMLNAVFAAQLDGLVQTEADALNFLAQHYPLTSGPKPAP